MTDAELMEQFQLLARGMEQSLERVETRINARMDARFEESERHLKIYIENVVTKRLDALYDGYVLHSEQQAVLETRTDALEDQMDDTRTRVAVLEHRLA